MTSPWNPDPLTVAEDIDGLDSNPGERCPVTEPFWCSRDRYHPGAHVNRSETGPGMIGWPNTTEPVGLVTLPERPRSGAVLLYVALALGVVGIAIFILADWLHA